MAFIGGREYLSLPCGRFSTAVHSERYEARRTLEQYFSFEAPGRNLADILHQIPLFRELTAKELRVLQNVVHIRKYAASEPVFVEAEPGAGMYIIRMGRVNIVLHHKSDNPVILSELHEGDFFGEMALLGDTERSASAIAQEQSELIGFFNPDLIEIISVYPQMGSKISLGLATTLPRDCALPTTNFAINGLIGDRMKKLFGEAPVRLIGIGILLVGIVLLVLTVQTLLVPFVGALFLAYSFEPGIVRLQRRGMGRGNAFILLLGLFTIAVLALLMLAPSWLALESANGFDAHFPSKVVAQLGGFDTWVESHIKVFGKVKITETIDQRVFECAERIATQLPSLAASFTVNLMLIPFMAYFLVRDGRSLRRSLVNLVPNRYFEMTLSMFHRIDQQIGGYLRGRLLECVLAGVVQMVLMGATEAILGIRQPNILLIGGVSGVLDLIPYVGPLFGAIFGTALYLGTDNLTTSSIWALLAIIAITHLIDNIVIAPAVLSHNVDLHPLTVVLALVIGGESLGILGLLIAVPVAASIKVIAQEVYANYQIQLR
jgi:putative permease